MTVSNQVEVMDSDYDVMPGWAAAGHLEYIRMP